MHDLLQRGAKRLDQLGGQVPHKADGVGEHDWPTVTELRAPGGGFQGGKQRVLYQHPGPGQRVEQAGLTRVGVADNRDRRHVTVPATAALGVADLFHGPDVAP
ncbi:Uncharacterised protein [Mycobacterium tuberculosis]|nr:Uncharacterised protein [Mycobacterium tuberculosis]COY58405.1 Uncharacterised protein [Mycobacterium tuberculosis]